MKLNKKALEKASRVLLDPPNRELSASTMAERFIKAYLENLPTPKVDYKKRVKQLENLIMEIYTGPCAYLPQCDETTALLDKLEKAYEGGDIGEILPYWPKDIWMEMEEWCEAKDRGLRFYLLPNGKYTAQQMHPRNYNGLTELKTDANLPKLLRKVMKKK